MPRPKRTPPAVQFVDLKDRQHPEGRSPVAHRDADRNPVDPARATGRARGPRSALWVERPATAATPVLVVTGENTAVESRLWATRRLLIQTARIHGRPSLGATHCWFRADASQPERFTDVDGKVLVEIRSTGQQTVVPPSFHPQGERLTWFQDGGPATVSAAELRASVRRVAVAALLGRHWPTHGRHETRLAVAGLLNRAQVALDDAIAIIGVAAEIGGSNGKGIDDVARAVRDTYRKLEAGEHPVTGGKSLAVLLGEGGDQIVARLCEWFGVRRSKIDDAVDELNGKHFIVRQGRQELIAHATADGLVLQEPAALRLRYANKRVQVGVRGNDTPVYKNKFAVWLASPLRREYDELVFAPPPLPVAPGDYNLWRGFAVVPDPDPTTAASRCGRYLEHLHEVVCAGRDGDCEYLLNLLALTVQRPGVPSEVAVALKGGMGTGKGLVAREFGALFGRHFVQLDRAEHLTGRFNAQLSGKVVVFADEAIWAGSKKELGSLKRLITEPTLQIERKGIDSATEPNFVHLFTATNEDWAAPAGFHERRWFVLEVNEGRARDFAYFEAIDGEMRHGGRAALLAFLQGRDLTNFNARQVPTTAALVVQQEHTMAPEIAWWKDCLDGGIIGDRGWPEWVSVEELHNAYLHWCDGMRIQRRVSRVCLTRRLERYLGVVFRKRVPPRDHRGQRVQGASPVVRRGRALRALRDARGVFDREAGVATAWAAVESDEEPKEKKGEELPF